MPISLRNFIGWTAGLEALAAVRPVSLSAQDRRDVTNHFIDAAEQPVLDQTQIKEPVIIESIDPLRKGKQHYARVPSKDGAGRTRRRNSGHKS